MKRITTASVWAFLGVMLLAGPAGFAQRPQEFQLSKDLSSLLEIPALFEYTPDALEARFEAEGFRPGTNPYFRWEGDRKVAVFSRRPYANVQVDLTVLGGRLPVKQAEVKFDNGRAVQVKVVVGDGQDGAGASSLPAWRDDCKGALVKLLKSQPSSQPRFFGALSQAKAECLVWKGEKAVACLDYLAKDGLLQFVVAAGTVDTDSLAAQSGLEVTGRGLELFLHLDRVLALPDLWQLTPAKVEQAFAAAGMEEPPYYQWLTSDKSGVRFTRRPFGNVSVDLTLFGGSVPVDEAVIEFTKGKASKVSVSLYNRGDSGEVTTEQFVQRYKTAGVALGKLLAVRPTERKPSAQTAVKISGWIWNSPSALASLEFNTEALSGQGAPEFLRLRMAAPDQREAFARDSGQTIRRSALGRSELPRFVKRETGGDIYVSGIPMVDQGDKGYCVVASCQRLFGYFHIPCDQHEMAQIAESDAGTGTNPVAMEEALKKIDSRFKVNFKALAYRLNGGGMGVPFGNRMTEVTEAKFEKFIRDYTEKGVPLLWALQLGLFPEEPAVSEQTGGGHMRLIIGSNPAKGELIFTDSWGAGHELKRMKMSHAFNATLAVYVIEPKEH